MARKALKGPRLRVWQLVSNVVRFFFCLHSQNLNGLVKLTWGLKPPAFNWPRSRVESSLRHGKRVLDESSTCQIGTGMDNKEELGHTVLG